MFKIGEHRMTVKIIGILLILCMFAFIYMFVNANTIKLTEYTIRSKKVSRDYKIVFVSDVHYGSKQNKDIAIYNAYNINELEPDILILGGDIVEEHTTLDDANDIFDAFGTVETTYGVYYVYGNHDKQEDSDTKLYTEEELADVLSKYHITVLQDTSVSFDDFNIVGREDGMEKHYHRRKPVKELTKDLDTDKFTILVDHIPYEYKNYICPNTDLILSGHTHAGQAFWISWYLKYNMLPCYGEYHYGDNHLIVSSGAGVGLLPFRTEKHCEYVIINIKKVG